MKATTAQVAPRRPTGLFVRLERSVLREVMNMLSVPRGNSGTSPWGSLSVTASTALPGFTVREQDCPSQLALVVKGKIMLFAGQTGLLSGNRTVQANWPMW